MPAMLAEVTLADGNRVYTTAPRLLETVRSWLPELQLQDLAAAQWAGWQRAEARRQTDLAETPAAERFAWTLAELGVTEPEQRAPELLAVHRAALHAGTEVPPNHVGLVQALRLAGYRVGLITNYDDADGAAKLLGDSGLAPHMEAVVVSGAEGKVKPHAGLFERALRALDVAPRVAWYVGDTYETDVLGAAAAGLTPVWLRRDGADGPAPEPGGVLTLPALEELADWLLD